MKIISGSTLKCTHMDRPNVSGEKMAMKQTQSKQLYSRHRNAASASVCRRLTSPSPTNVAMLMKPKPS